MTEPINDDDQYRSGMQTEALGFSLGARRKEILDSWERCRIRGMHQDDLPPVIASSLPRGGTGKIDIPFLGPEFTAITEYLKAVGAVYMLLYDDMTVFCAGGDPVLRKKLADMHLDVGSNLAEASLGTAAPALIRDGAEERWVIGREHYLTCMHGLASYAARAGENYSSYIFCAFLPPALFTRAFIALVRHVYRIHSLTSRLHKTTLELGRQRELFNQLKEIHEHALMLVDFSQKILSVNQQFEHLFELSQGDVLNHALTEIFPELESMAISLQTGKRIDFSEVHFEGYSSRNKTIYVSCTPWKQNDIVNGMIFAFTSNLQAAEVPQQKSQKGRLREGYTFDGLIGNSESFREIREMARGIANSNSSIILTGESGTGKEVFAQAIHNESSRQRNPFVAVNCSAFPKDLIGSELFGYGDGAFTGARKGGAMGKFEFANKGTLFLDEVAELPLDVQAILLRVLEERAVTRIGSNTAIPVDVRIIAATNRNLLAMVKENTFRLDLYYRLNVISLELPPLRSRREDIPLLVDAFLRHFNAMLHRQVTSCSPELMDILVRADWPGNIRQLRNTIEFGVNVAKGHTLQVRDLPRDITNSVREKTPQKDVVRLPQVTSFETWERDRIWELMQKHRGNKSRVAEEMGMCRVTLYKKLKRYGL